MPADHSGPQRTLPKIRGPTPGQLDGTQASRLLRQPDSTLSFADFDLNAASSQEVVPDLRSKRFLQDELYRSKRIVVETASSGASFWRFVPDAQKEDGVPDEGQWPRAVIICG